MNVSHQTIRIDRGKHASPEEGACVMELASMLGGEGFSDRPRSVCPVVAGFLRGYNDLVDDARRQDLYRYASDVVGSAGDRMVRWRRRRMLHRWARRLAERRSPALAMRTGFRFGGGDEVGGHVGHLVSSSRRRADGDALHGEVLELVDALLALGREPAEATPARSRTSTLSEPSDLDPAAHRLEAPLPVP
jgi:hypothetical protein